MAIFFELLSAQNKKGNLLDEIQKLNSGSPGTHTYEKNVASFSAIDEAPFLYSMPNSLIELAANRNTLAALGADARQGIGAATRFHRLWWEVLPETVIREGSRVWPFMAHGTPYSPFYKPSLFRFKWGTDGAEAKADVCHRYPYLNGNYRYKIQAEEHYFSPGLCYGKRTTNFSVQIMPADHVFSFEGTAIATENSTVDPWVLLGLLNSKPVAFWLSRICAQHKAYNYLQSLPVPTSFDNDIGNLARRGWHVSRMLDRTNEVSNAFLLPSILLTRVDDYDPGKLRAELPKIKEGIDKIAFDLYGFSKSEISAVQVDSSSGLSGEIEGVETSEDDTDDKDISAAIDDTEELLCWAIGVAFGRFDLRLATGERAIPPEPAPFEPLPAKSPGMLPDRQDVFHRHAGILVDDPGHPHDLAHLVEEVLVTVATPVPQNVRRWLQREFFKSHLKQYSKSRRRAPIYWPLSTASGSYTLWVYYPDLTNQTLYTAINDFLEAKLKHLEQEASTLRAKGSERTRDEEKRLEALIDLEQDLVDLRDTIQQIAPTYRPNHDDGVSIAAAPLWPLFRHKPWQKVLKDTWTKLEKGEVDWAHIAMAYWPERVREKCKTDKSLAIAHDLEHVYEEPEEASTSSHGR